MLIYSNNKNKQKNDKLNNELVHTLQTVCINVVNDMWHFTNYKRDW